MADIFVSYDSEDRERIRPLVEVLEGLGWSVWWDRDLVAGPSFEEKIEQALAEARCVVVAWSERSIASRWCRAEANEGLERNALVPIRIDDVRPPLRFRESHTASLIGWPDYQGDFDAFLAGLRQHLSSAAPTSTQPETPRDRETSIAVLPFQNLSNDPDQEYFSDGIAEDILNELSKNSALAVRPRSSSFTLKGQSLDIPMVGRRLKVTHVLDGSVRRSGGRVRVVAQLSDVNANRSIWSERYDRELTDIFEVQDEITREILRALNVHLIGRHTSREFAGTEAYNAFLRGRHHLGQWEFTRALTSYEKATQLDSQNADAWSGLARILDMRGPERGQSLADHRKQMTALFDRVLSIDPAHPHALAWKAENTFFRDREYQAAIDQLVTLANANPNHEEVHRSLSWILQAIGRSELFLRVTHRMQDIAPLSREAMINEINAYLAIGRLDDARQAIADFPRLQSREDPGSASWLAILDRDAHALDEIVNRSMDGWSFPYQRAWFAAMVPFLKGDFTRAREVLATRSGRRPPTVLEGHMIALIERDVDAALNHYAEGLDKGYWFAFVRAQLNFPFRQTFPECYDNPRFNQLLQTFKMDPDSTTTLRVTGLNLS